MRVADWSGGIYALSGQSQRPESRCRISEHSSQHSGSVIALRLKLFVPSCGYKNRAQVSAPENHVSSHSPPRAPRPLPFDWLWALSLPKRRLKIAEPEGRGQMPNVRRQPQGLAAFLTKALHHFAVILSRLPTLNQGLPIRLHKLRRDKHRRPMPRIDPPCLVPP